MKRMLLTALTVVAGASTAALADGLPAKSPIAPALGDRWTGFYAGFNAGFREL